MTDEQRQKRIHHHMYETCEGIAEHAERIVALEELCAALYRCADAGKPCETCPLYDGDGGCMDELSMDELGVPRGQ
jgi:hypothetical protein